MAKQLKLRIHSVKCVDETGGKYMEKFGNDEIYLGGFSLDAEGTPVKIPTFCVYSDFDDGEVKTYNPPKEFAVFNLENSNNWPKTLGVAFMLFERDSGDMNEALDKAFQKFKEEVSSKKAVAKTDDGVSSFAIPWGTIFTVVIPMIAGYLKDKLSSAISDDAFPLESASIVLPAANYNWNGNTVSPVTKVEFRGNDGVYYLFYDWEISGVSTNQLSHAVVRDHRKVK